MVITSAFTVFAMAAVFMLVVKVATLHGSMVRYGAYQLTTSWWVETFLEVGVIALWVNMLLFAE